jgi:UDP-N-acetylmuramoyl-tripeptide--D-alanyl-D-alanine ligase
MMNWPQRLQAPLWKLKCFLMYVAAYLWRRLLFRTTFIAITGSVGKTTAKECLAAIMSSRFPTASTWANQNDDSGVPRSILRVRPWHRFAVLEVAASGRGLMRRSAPLVSPEVALVLTVARTHMRSHKTLESVAAEKFELLKALRPGGTAVLNADSSWVAAMAPRCERKVVWFGGSAESNLRADEISSCWPERLTFRLHAGSSSWRVKTQLVGTHWTTSLLGALATAQVCGLPPADALAAVENLQPTPARMQPVSVLNRVTILRDEYNGSIDTLGAALRTLADAEARRKVLVITDVGDTNQRSAGRMRLLAK